MRKILLLMFLFVYIVLNERVYSGECENKILNEYINYAKNTIKASWKPHYSDSEGLILLSFKIRNNGEIYDIKIVKSGGTLLDLQAVNTLRECSPLKPVPSGVQIDYMDASIAFKYHTYETKKQLEEQNAVHTKNESAPDDSAVYKYKPKAWIDAPVYE